MSWSGAWWQWLIVAVPVVTALLLAGCLAFMRRRGVASVLRGRLSARRAGDVAVLCAALALEVAMLWIPWPHPPEGFAD